MRGIIRFNSDGTVDIVNDYGEELVVNIAGRALQAGDTLKISGSVVQDGDEVMMPVRFTI